ncbi:MULTISPECIES: BlaI/MecI/CopY family transcriptional regulator [Chryseobacterium]|uniref:BlaI/MecI/CopY family transcriptional regulator n=1 Tax=Chryseobacterium TaxID=59732 RepID=UPI0015540EC5|nr:MULTISPECIES: BlaI/MecI/CopY family transcriptional regulator [unclassified Chryseobacterium]MDC8105875.1 BlaI/MecI/CopY family transcriptional regulator [Chryseobacterium sp. B21-037]MDQ1804378.1 BlaI/MecI/CopY family transcriptional regulator [Chryseobacterium sp. CKR4-1]WBV55089.1 BlaI/MecI/CopY family transcriptional regulator [Chryseobacterium daecheongense]
MKEIKLTDSEKVLMEIIWDKQKVFMKDILDLYPEPKPASTTVATLLKRMQNKDLIGYTLYGNSREYYPKVAKGEYFREEMTSMIDRFFNSSVTQFASFFTSNTKLTQKQLIELREIIDQKIKE